MKRIILKPGEENRALAGHPWIYDNEVDRILEGSGGGAHAAALIPGELADVESSRKQYLGRAFVNPHSKIIARIYSPSKEGVDKGFFKRRIREALGRRERGQPLMAPAGDPALSGRILFGEADFLPGLIIDRFCGWPLADIEAASCKPPLTFEAVQNKLGAPVSWLSLQFLIYGIDLRREEILSALEEVLEGPAGIYEKSGARVRELEGLPLREGILRGGFPPEGIVVFENGFPFLVNPAEGQKTGHFFDQKENRLLAALHGRNLFAERKAGAQAAGGVLDVCSYTGGFAIHISRLAAAGGFDVPVTAVDVSAPALETLNNNARLNGVEDRIQTVEADAFETLRSCERKKEKFDMVVLDPPAFAKSRSALGEALRGYKEINLRALRLVSPGGILVTCSCSQALDEAAFRRVITEAAADAERRLFELDFRYQGADHPILVGYEESRYLKCGIYRVL
ncbi:MAG: class I SAM-dependent rRNA methyltransferase [Treponema sp.]|jgi:23S rRNA (cytosine1962-C5)-methyltransferase|nr:class I SAM-dependent rRNA methyltransferase [Treponema sp.]